MAIATNSWMKTTSSASIIDPGARYLDGIRVHDLDIAPDGRVWLRGGTCDLDAEESGSISGLGGATTSVAKMARLGRATARAPM
jgi:hypothetical protein